MSPDLPDEAPHRMIDKLLDNVSSIRDSIGESLSGILDKLPLGTKGPHKAVSKVVSGVGEAQKTIGEGLAEGLDQPVEIAKGV